ncbi:immunity 22 family protein [Blastopirellula marina]|uniref:Uncharacterized protein n=1 Tax=Blastopirellula marina TaxID=124 RepID=A0A2S8FTI6_9BACT|nr:immunity 22 family protein [Blastopirellula marina]PQO35476.1 hypothetical protein C5Y98_14045 [Blastopirellula marina]PTL44116.1 hypothetical protein C5Y97_14055 [Blastopirellula marina]
MLDSDVDGYVAVWIGSFPKKSEFNAYLKETYGDDDVDRPISQFAVDLKETFYDHDFVFGEWYRGKPRSVETMLDGWRGADSFLTAAVAAAKKKKIADGNTIIIAYDHQFNSNRWPKDSPIRFLGNFPYSETQAAPQEDRHTDEVATLRYSPDGNYVVSGGDDGRIGVWNAKTGAPVVAPRQAFVERFDDVDDLCFSHDGKRLVAGIVNQSCLWDPFPDAPATTKPAKFPVSSISPDGKYALYCAYDKVLVYDLDAGKEDKTLSKKMPAENARFLPGGELVTVTPKKLFLWKFATTEKLAELPAGFEQRDKLAVSPQGKYAVTCGGPSAAIWDLAGRKLHKQIELDGAIDEFIIPNENECCFLLGDGRLQVYSLKKGTQTKQLEPAKSRYFKMQASPEGNLIALKEGKRVVVWDLKNGELLGYLPPDASPDNGGVSSFAISQGGKQFAIGTGLGRVILFNRVGAKFTAVVVNG